MKLIQINNESGNLNDSKFLAFLLDSFKLESSKKKLKVKYLKDLKEKEEIWKKEVCNFVEILFFLHQFLIYRLMKWLQPTKVSVSKLKSRIYLIKIFLELKQELEELKSKLDKQVEEKLLVSNLQHPQKLPVDLNIHKNLKY